MPGNICNNTVRNFKEITEMQIDINSWLILEVLYCMKKESLKRLSVTEHQFHKAQIQPELNTLFRDAHNEINLFLTVENKSLKSRSSVMS